MSNDKPDLHAATNQEPRRRLLSTDEGDEAFHLDGTTSIGIDVGGHVFVMPLRKWHACAVAGAQHPKLGVHLSHCNFGEHAGCCKYGDDDACPALTDEWSWFGKYLQRADKQIAGARLVPSPRDEYEAGDSFADYGAQPVPVVPEGWREFIEHKESE